MSTKRVRKLSLAQLSDYTGFAMLSATSKHAIKALSFLSLSDETKYFSVDTIAEDCGAPAAFLSKIIKKLAKAGLVETKKGARGGVRRKKDEITFREVCTALDDPIVVENCLLSKSNCNKDAPCPFHDLWVAQRAQIGKFLDRMTI